MLQLVPIGAHTTFSWCAILFVPAISHNYRCIGHKIGRIKLDLLRCTRILYSSFRLKYLLRYSSYSDSMIGSSSGCFLYSTHQRRHLFNGCRRFIMLGIRFCILFFDYVARNEGVEFCGFFAQILWLLLLLLDSIVDFGSAKQWKIKRKSSTVFRRLGERMFFLSNSLYVCVCLCVCVYIWVCI